MLRLQMYDFTFAFTPGKNLNTADTLSRSINSVVDVTCTADEHDASISEFLSLLPVSDRATAQIRDFTGKDDEMKILKQHITDGFPSVRNECNNVVKPYFNVAHDLHIVNDIIFKGNRIVIPKPLRKGILQQIHHGHLGEVKCKARARESVYWPGINNDISNVVATCNVCAYHMNAFSKETLLSHDNPTYPFQKIGTDLCSVGSKSYLIIFLPIRK